MLLFFTYFIISSVWAGLSLPEDSADQSVEFVKDMGSCKLVVKEVIPVRNLAAETPGGGKCKGARFASADRRGDFAPADCAEEFYSTSTQGFFSYKISMRDANTGNHGCYYAGDSADSCKRKHVEETWGIYSYYCIEDSTNVWKEVQASGQKCKGATWSKSETATLGFTVDECVEYFSKVRNYRGGYISRRTADNGNSACFYSETCSTPGRVASDDWTIIQFGCKNVNRLYEEPGYYTCECRNPNHPCFSDGTCFDEYNCPEMHRRSTDLNVDGSYSFTYVGPGSCRRVDGDHTELVDYDDVTFEYCRNECASNAQCNAFAYEPADKECDLYSEGSYLKFSDRTGNNPASCYSKTGVSASRPYDAYFSMSGGGCDTEANCVSSRNYPNNYGANEGCSITILQDAAVTHGSTFSIQTTHDHLIIDDRDVNAASDVQDNLAEGAEITWNSNSNNHREGWQLCFWPEGVVLGSASCESPQKICSGMTFAAIVGYETDPVGCLFSAPGPSWFYFEIEASGSIAMTLSAGSDIDYAVFGPFSSESDTIAACGNPEPIVACSYSSSPIENLEITNGQSGELYLLLITNYARRNQLVTTSIETGTGSLKCPESD